MMNDCANNEEVKKNDGKNSNIDKSNDDDSGNAKVEKDFCHVRKPALLRLRQQQKRKNWRQ